MSEASSAGAASRTTDSEDLDTLRNLVRRAFDQARQSGRQEWQAMTTAVLKNRLLQLTSRQFAESNYGVDSVLDLVRLIPDTVNVDDTKRPPLVTLLTATASRPQPGPPEASRIRTDLWNAVFDFSSPGTYIWDGTHARSDVAAQAGDLQLPTLTEAEFDHWRRDFAAKHPDLDIQDWAEKSYSTYGLPVALRGHWNRFIRTRAIDRLAAWFNANEITAPPDMVEYAETRIATIPDNSETEALRRYVLKCVAAMRPSELKSLLIPASVAARVTR